MTKRTLVLLPVLALALVFVGCSQGDSGSGSKAVNAFDQVGSDPVAEGLARGYVSTVASDFSGNVAYTGQASQPTLGTEPVSRDIFQSPSTQGRAMSGQVGVSTTVPARTWDIDPAYASAQYTAEAGPNDSIIVKFGEQTATIFPVSRNGQDYAFSQDAGGTITRNGESEFPKVLESPGVGRAVVLVSGTVVPVQE
jgi:hypothetical protein